jgi:hypothetical protein
MLERMQAEGIDPSAPGAYTLIAWESVDGEAYYNPEFLKNYEGQGRALHVTEGERKSEQLQVVPAEEDPQ